MLIWQGVVWANPEILRQHELQPKLFFDPTDTKENIFSALSGYLSKALARFEIDPENRNLFSIKKCAEAAVADLRRIQDLPGEVLEEGLIVSGSPESGEVVIDLGPCRIRYYNHRIPGAENPSSAYKVIESGQIGEYLSRQILMKRTSPGGFIARGDPKELFQAFMDKKSSVTEIRRSVKKLLPKAMKDFEKRIEQSDLEPYVVKKKIRTALKRVATLDLIEFDSVVFPDEEDKTKARGWLHGFNTAYYPDHTIKGAIHKINEYLIRKFKSKVGLSRQVLDLIEKDEPTLEEYLFHEFICPYFGHEKARAIQEVLFPENYKGIIGDSERGRRDGELALALKEVTWKMCETPTFEVIQREELDKEKPVFEKQDFTTSDGPQSATRFFTKFKKYHKRLTRLYLLQQARRKGRRIYSKAREILKKLKEEYTRILIRLRWIWEFDSTWSDARTLLEKKDPGELTEEEQAKIRAAAREVVNKHREFVKEHPEAGFLDEDPQVTEVLNTMYQIIDVEKEERSKGIQSPVVAIRRRSPETEAKKIPVNIPKKPKEKTTFRDELRSISLKRLFLLLAAASVLATGFYFLNKYLGLTSMPYVGTAIIVAAVALPLVLFVYMMIKYWSWKRLVIALGLSALISYLLPVPWLGPAIAVIILGTLIKTGELFRWRRGRIQRGGPAKSGQKAAQRATPSAASGGESAEAQSSADGSTGQRQPEDEVEFGHMEGEMLVADYEHSNKIRLSPDVVWIIMKIKGLLYGDQEEKQVGEYEYYVEHNFKSWLDCLFVISPEDNKDMMPNNKMLEELRPLVDKKTKEMEWGFTYVEEVKTLRNWQNADNERLAKAMHEISGEIIGLLASRPPEESRKQGLAVVHLVAEHFKISPKGKKFWDILLYMTLILRREQIKEGRIIGEAKAKDYFKLSRLEFYWDNIPEAEKALETAVRMEHENKEAFEAGIKVHEDKEAFEADFLREHGSKGENEADYNFALGIVKHHMAASNPRKWKEARKHYRDSITFRKNIEATELGTLKNKLAKILIKKTKEKKYLYWDKTDTDGPDNPNRRGPAASRLIQKLIAPYRPYEMYALINAPEVEEVVFMCVPFAVFSALLTTGVFGLYGFLGAMATVSGIFVALHFGNIKRAPPEADSFWKKLYYAFRTPLSVVTFNMITSAVFGATLDYMIKSNLPMLFIGAFAFLFTWIAYEFARMYHKDANKEAVETKHHAPATLQSFKAEDKTFDSPAAFRWMQKIIAPYRPYEMYALIDAPKAEERLFTLLPFAVFSTLLATGVFGFYGFLGSMAAVYGIFSALHFENLKQTPTEVTSIWGKLRYAFKAPLTVVGFNIVTSTVFGGVLYHMVKTNMPGIVIAVFTVLFTTIAYEFARMWHEEVNEKAVEKGDYAPAVIKQETPDKVSEMREKIKRGEKTNLLFICTLNAQRSFMMHMVSKDIISEKGFDHVSVDSCGTYVSGSPHSSLADICIEKGVDPGIVNGFSTSEINPEKVQNADYMIVGDPALRELIVERYPEYAGKVLLATKVFPNMAKQLHQYAPSNAFENTDYLPDYNVVSGVLTAGGFYEMFYRAVSRDIFGIEESDKEELFEISSESGLPLDTFEIPNNVAIYPGAGHDAWGIAAALEAFPKLDTFVLVDNQYNKARLSSDQYYLRMLLANKLDSCGIELDEINREKALKGEFNENGLLEFEATLELEGDRQRKVRFVLDTRNYFIPHKSGYGLSDGFGLTLVKYPGWGGAMGDVDSDKDVVTYDWGVFFMKALEETATGGLVMLKNALVPSDRLAKKYDLKRLHSTNLKKPGKVKDNEHVIYKKRAASDNIGKIRITDAIPGDEYAIKRLYHEIRSLRDIGMSEEELGKLIRRIGRDDNREGYLRVCRIDSEVAGYIYAAKVQNIGTRQFEEKHMNIIHIAVHGDYRKWGVAKALFRDVYDTARKDGYESFSVYPDHIAVKKIAISLGFTKDDIFYVKEKQAEGKKDISGPGCENILKRASSAIPRFVNALIAASKRDEKVVLALDLELGEGEINALLRKLIKVLPTIERNNEDLERFFENLEIIRGEGAQLARRVSNITDTSRGGVEPENVIVITRNANVVYYKEFEGRATVAGVEDGTFSENSYLPLLEIMLFAIGRHLGWDEATLLEHYAMIPNVTSAANLTPEDYALLFGKDKRTMVIRLIPNAEEFDKKELREMIDSMRTMLARA